MHLKRGFVLHLFLGAKQNLFLGAKPHPFLYFFFSRSNFSAIASKIQSWVDMPSLGLVGLRGRLALTSSMLAKVSAVILMLKFLSLVSAEGAVSTDELPRLMIASIFFSSILFGTGDWCTAVFFRGGGETAISSIKQGG
ncbi:hypothetical protein ACFP2F_21680 [Hymenobacter artigasi]|uniref:Uncharacterized protein n=1 Tax=Hymenobacter artigasi TaxID=2719616 RepID=A0ABX1HNQ9_9BACT|nr:hypothetical protein [Hymenobacter artigasi]NKI91894.1 hypothetical protein [Hymenobacter artigasi]